MKKSQLYKILIFVILLITIDRTFGFLVSKLALKYKHDNRLELVINNKLDKDVLIIGSSRALNGICPKTIEQITGFTCYNLGVSGTNIVFHETILDLVLNSKNIPKTIIYTVDDPASLYKFDDLVIYKQEELYPYVYNDFVNHIVSNRLEKENWVTSVSLSYRNNVNFMSAIKYLARGHEVIAPEINNIDDFGSNLMEGFQKGMEDMKYLEEYPYSLTLEDNLYSSTLLNIISKCKKNNIQLILAIPPVYYTPSTKFNKRIKQLANNQCIVLDYSNEFTENKMFYNYGHLNKNGAIKFSEFLSPYLLKSQ